MNDLAHSLKMERLSAYARLRGGFPMPVAGALYWLALGFAGRYLDLTAWLQLAFYTSGAIFPLALLIAAPFRLAIMKDTSAVKSVILPALIGMMLFWPMAIAVMWTAPGVAPLILAIGMSTHWPVIGWSYGRTALFCGHALIRAVLVFYIWLAHPGLATTGLPFAVASVYAVTVVIVFIDSAIVRHKLAEA